MPLDPFQVLGITTEQPPATGSSGTEVPSGVDPFQVLGVKPGEYTGPPPRVPMDTVNQPTAAPAQAPQQSSLSNQLGGIPSGLYRGVANVANLPGNALNLGMDIAAGMKSAPYHFPPLINPNPTNYEPVGPTARAIHSGSEALGNVAATGPLAEIAAPLLPAAMAPVARAMNPFEGSVAARAGQAVPLATGGAAGQAASEVVPEPFKEPARLAASLGAGGLTSMAGAARGSIAPDTAQLADLAVNRYGLPLRAGQITDSRFLRTADSALKSVPGSGYGGTDENFFNAFNREVAKGVGINDATKLSANAVNTARSQAGGTIERVENGARVNIGDPQSMNDLAQWESKWSNSPNFNRIQPLLNGVLKNVGSGDELSGDTYGKLIHQGSPIDSAMGMESADVRNAASELKSILRNSLSRSLSPEDFDAYQQARTHYHAIMNIIKPALSQADVVGGPSPTTGDVIPWNLRNIVNKAYEGSGAFAEPGSNRFNDLADIGQRFAKEFRSSGTAERSMIYEGLKHAAGPLAGAGGVAAMEGALPAMHHLAMGAAAIPLAARIASSPLRSQAYAKSLINKGMGNAPTAMEAAGTPAVPLATSEGMRELEPPPQTATNPRTGLPEFSLESNQQQAQQAPSAPPADPRRQLADDLVSRLPGGASPDPALATPQGLQAWVDQNKPQLRALLGGQGMNNVLATGAMLRRASAAPPGTTTWSVASSNLPPGVPSASHLASLAMLNPALTRELARVTKGGKVNAFSQKRMNDLISASTGRKTAGGRI